MKKIDLDFGKLKLKKETIGSLISKEDMRNVAGGVAGKTSDLCSATICPTNFFCPSVPPICIE
jgi:hypothetical protein